ncbi:TPA: hypothetical protein ACXM5D_000234 [Proteus mirabilis]
MTVSTELSHEEYVGNGVTTDFDFRFRIFESKHLIVVVADSEGNETTLKNGTDYTIVGAGSYHGGKVVLNKPLARGWKILLERDLPVVQETDLRNQGKFFAEVHEDAFDYLTMLIQKALGTFSLSLRKPTYLSNYYDAKGNRIANLAPPKLGTDAVNKDYVDNSIKDIDSKTLRVKDKSINVLPNTEQRANKILAFDDNGQPITVLPESGSASDVLIELAKPTGTKLIGYRNGTLNDKLSDMVIVNVDNFPSIQEAVNYAASLSGNAHSPSSASGQPTWIQPNTTCRVVKLNGKKYPIKTTLNITGDVSIDAGFGGVYLTDDFIPDNSGYAVVCSKGNGNQYAGNISDFLIDARAKTVNGFKIKDGYANRLDGIYVANIDGNGIHIAGGMGVHLSKFYAVGVLKSSNPLSAAHIIEGSDHHVSSGEGRYFRFGTWLRSGGNNRIDKIHNWGMYDDTIEDQNSRMKCCFVIQNSINNSFSQCIADSPSKWDYDKTNLSPVDGYINGGIGFFIDTGSSGNTFSQCQTFVNVEAYNSAGLSVHNESLYPFLVGSINCSFSMCENSNSTAWHRKTINHIPGISIDYTYASGIKNFVGIEDDISNNRTFFKKAIGVPLVVNVSKSENASEKYIVDFNECSYISVSCESNIEISIGELTNQPLGYLECTLSVYSSARKLITFVGSVSLARNTPSLEESGTQVFRVSTNNGGKNWMVRLIANYS